MIGALRAAAAGLKRRRPEVQRVGYFGSLASGNYGFGSDADVVVVVSNTSRAFSHRLLDYDVGRLPVPSDVLIYTEEEFRQILSRADLFSREMMAVVWI